MSKILTLENYTTQFCAEYLLDMNQKYREKAAESLKPAAGKSNCTLEWDMLP